MEQGIVYRPDTGLFRYSGWPTVCRDERGTIYVACSGHRLGHLCPLGKNLLLSSSDEGRSWSAPLIVNDTSLDDRDAGLVYIGDGRMLLSYFNHPAGYYLDKAEWLKKKVDPVALPMALGLLEGLKNLTEEENNYGSFIRLSDNYGMSWSGAIKVPVTSPHSPTILKDGSLLYLGKEFHSGRPEKNEILAFLSRDVGVSWEFLSKIELPEGCSVANVHEPHAIELPDGRILGAIRAQGKPVAHEFTIYTCISDDGGLSWTKPKATGISGSPPHLLLLKNGDILLSYGRREPPFGECARISRDGGESFGEEIFLRPAPHADLGYPSSIELDDGSIFTVYYQALEGDRFCSILYTRWKLNEC